MAKKSLKEKKIFIKFCIDVGYFTLDIRGKC